MIKGAIVGAALVLASTGCGNAPSETEIETAKQQRDVITRVDIAPYLEAREKVGTTGTTEKKTTEQKTEQSTGEINADGYGWVQLQYSAPYNIMEGHLTKSNGSIRVFGHRETWYSTNEASGKATARDIPGKHVADDGTIRDEDGYICVASSDLPFYSIVMTSVGPGKVYDCGCSHGTIDVYTTW